MTNWYNGVVPQLPGYTAATTDGDRADRLLQILSNRAGMIYSAANPTFQSVNIVDGTLSTPKNLTTGVDTAAKVLDGLQRELDLVNAATTGDQQLRE